MAPWAVADPLRDLARFDEVERNCVYWLGRDGFSPATVANVSIRLENNAAVALVEHEVAARSWLLWESPVFAELAVATEPRFQRRGLARAVVSALISELLKSDRTPLFIASVNNTASNRLAMSFGFTRCAEDEFAGYLGAGQPPRSDRSPR